MAIKFEATGDFSDLIAENQKYQRQVTTLTEQLSKLTGGAAPMGTAGVKAFRDMQRAADQARKSIETPTDAFVRQVQQLDAALGKNMLSPKEHAAAIDQLAAKYSGAAGPVDQFRIAQEQLGAKLASNQLTQEQYAAAMERAKASTLATADGAQRYQIELAALDRQQASGAMNADEYQQATRQLAATLAATATPVDQVKIELAELQQSLATGKITVGEYDTRVVELSTAAAGLATPIERVQTKMALLDDELRRGVIDQQSYAQQANRLRTEYVENTTATQRYQDGLDRVNTELRTGQMAHEQHARAVDALEKEFREAASPAEVYEKAVADLSQQLSAGTITATEYEQAVARHQVAMDQATGAGETHASMTDKLGAKMLALGTGYLSFQAILGKVQEALAYVNQETEKAIGSADKMTDSNKRLAQVATSAEDYDMMVSRADELAAKYGEDRDVVRKVSFSARSEGFESSLDNIMKYSDVVAAESQATVAGQVPNLFGGEISADQGINATLAAAEASRLSFEEIARALPKVSEGAALQKASAAETMGVTSVMAGHFSSGDTAADRFKALATKLSINESTKGMGILGGIEELQRQQTEWQAAGGEGDDPLKKFLGESAELNVAFGLLVERMPDVKKRIAEIETEIETVGSGGQGALARKHAQSFDGSTETGRLNQAMEQRRQAQIAEEIANERQFAEEGAKREAAIASEKARQKDEGYIGLAQYGGHAAGNAATLVGADEETAAAMTRAGTEAIGGTSFTGFLARRVASAATLGMTDVAAAAGGFFGARQDQAAAAAPPLAREQQIVLQAQDVLKGSVRQTQMPTDTAESVRDLGSRLQTAYREGGATEYVEQTRTEIQTRIQQVQAVAGPDQAAQVKVLQDSLAELQKLTALLAENAAATKDLRDASRTTPRPGASAAAAAPNSQRLGR